MAKKLCLLRDVVKKFSRKDLYGQGKRTKDRTVEIRPQLTINLQGQEPMDALLDLNVDISKMFKTIG